MENREPCPSHEVEGAAVANSIHDVFRRLDPSGTGMLSKDGVREALSQMGLDASDSAVSQVCG